MANYYELATAIDLDPSKVFELRSIVVPPFPPSMISPTDSDAKVENQPPGTRLGLSSESQPVDLDTD